MDAFSDMLFDLFGDSSLSVLALIVFVATAATAFGVMALVHSRGAVKRRAAGINNYSGELAESEHSLRRSGLKAIQRVLDYTSKHYEAGDKGDGKVLRRRMVQAGIYNPQAVAMFFVANWFAKPIKLVGESMGEIAKGRFDHRIREQRGDEFGELYLAFDRMAQALQDRQAGANVPTPTQHEHAASAAGDAASGDTPPKL